MRPGDVGADEERKERWLWQRWAPKAVSAREGRARDEFPLPPIGAVIGMGG
jgi:hypothetical protein